jgi:hypothetical protein
MTTIEELAHDERVITHLESLARRTTDVLEENKEINGDSLKEVAAVFGALLAKLVMTDMKKRGLF